MCDLANLQVVWYELPSFYVFHIANAWEDDGKVKVRALVALLLSTGNLCTLLLCVDIEAKQ